MYTMNGHLLIEKAEINMVRIIHMLNRAHGAARIEGLSHAENYRGKMRRINMTVNTHNA